MKKIITLFLIVMSIVNLLFAQKNDEKTYRLDSLHAETRDWIVTYNDDGYVIKEEVADYWYPLYKSIVEYNYDENWNVIKESIFSWKNNEWICGSFIDYTYNEQNQRLTRLNYNDIFGTGPELGGRGYYSYNEEGQLIQYKQNWANDAELSKDDYEYEDGKLLSIIYWGKEGGSYVMWYRDFHTYNTDGTLKEIINQDWISNAWKNYSKYSYYYNDKQDVIKRDLQRASGSGWNPQVRDRYIWHYSDVPVSEVQYPNVNRYSQDWENWFGGNYQITAHEWWTLDVNMVIFDKVEDVDYLYFVTNPEPPDSTSINKFGKQISFQVFPNPVITHCSINCEDAEIQQVEIIDFTCRLVATFGENTKVLNVAHLKKGNYFVRIYTNKGTFARKLLKN